MQNTNTYHDFSFLPLEKSLFELFISGHKAWEIWESRDIHNSERIKIGNIVEIGIEDDEDTRVFGVIKSINKSSSIQSIFEKVDFKKIAPTASSVNEAIDLYRSKSYQKQTGDNYFALEISTELPTIDIDQRFHEIFSSGKKSSTIRKGNRIIPLGPAVVTIGHEKFPIYINEVKHKVISNLNDNDALNDGFSNVDELLKQLSIFYDKLHKSDQVTIISFKRI